MVIETVGVGQSETDVDEAADTVAVVVQPGSGDVLQFLKAGIMEIPDVLVVTKADLGRPPHRALRDLDAAMRALGAGDVPVLAVSSLPPAQGIEELARALDAHRERPRPAGAAVARAPRERAGGVRGRARRARAAGAGRRRAASAGWPIRTPGWTSPPSSARWPSARRPGDP